MTDILRRLNATLESPYLEEACARAEKDPAVPEWLTEGYLLSLADEYGFLPKTRDAALSVLPHVASNPDLCFFAKVLYHVLAQGKGFDKSFTALSLPKAPEGVTERIGYDCVALFPVLAHLRPSYEELTARGVDADVARTSLLWTDAFFSECCQKEGRAAYTKPYFAAYSAGIYVKTLIVGRLRFEPQKNVRIPVRIYRNAAGKLCILMDGVRIHASGYVLGSYGCEDETDARDADLLETADAYEGYAVDEETHLAQPVRTRLPKSEWTQILASGDSLLRVHIPVGPVNGKLTREVCEASYARAREIFTRCYPEYRFTSLALNCWMLSPILKEILPPTSNILTFAEEYIRYPIKSSALDAFLYVFGIHAKSVAEISLDALPENGSLQRGVKQKAMEGELVYEFGGYIPF